MNAKAIKKKQRPILSKNAPDATNSVVNLSIEIDMPDIIPAADRRSKRGTFTNLFSLREFGETCLISSSVISLIVSIRALAGRCTSF